MPYSAEISRARPTCFLFLIDRSLSMADPFGGAGDGKRKSDGVADAINRLLQNLALRCAKSEGIRDYFQVGVLGYGAKVGPAFGGALTGRGLVPISDVANNPLRIEERQRKVDDGAGGLVEQSVKFPVWFEPQADGATPMCEALRQASDLIGEFIRQVPDAFPPTIVNITDGDANDGDPEPAAADLQRSTTNDGAVLLFNVHLSSARAAAVEFPATEDGLPDEYAKKLFRMSSELPARMREVAGRDGYKLGNGSRGFVFNADLVSVVRFLDIGTRVDAKNLR